MRHTTHSGTQLIGVRRLAVWLRLLPLLALLGVALAMNGCGASVAPLTQTTAPAASDGGRPALGAEQSATPAPTPPGPVWIPLRSQSAADVLAAVKQAPFLGIVSSAPPSSDGYTDVSRLGSPVMVIAYHAPGDTSTSSPDYYEVPVLTASGSVDATVDAQLNASHTAVSVDSVTGYSAPTAHWPATLVSADRAEQLVLATFHVGPRTASAARLVYLAAYDTMAIETGKLNWNAGGGGPMSPIWLVPGADGRDYFVCYDGHAYTLAQLPLSR